MNFHALVFETFKAYWNGRHVYFCNYGRGRGSNLWKDCKYVFLLGDWHLRTSTAIAKVGSLKSCPAQGLDLNKLGAPYTHDPPLDPLVCR